MAISGLGYIIIGASDLDAWERFACGVMGLEARREEGGALLLRADSRDWRFRVEQNSVDDIVAVGWECSTEAEYRATVENLGGDAIEDTALAKARGVCGLTRFTDPAGVACELFWGAAERKNSPFVSPLGISGFVTGDQGLGHVVIVTPDPAAYADFYRQIGFRISDFVDMAMGPDMVLPVWFMHCNPRHHSLAFAAAPPPFKKKCIHLMLQTQQVDDVGFAIDRADVHGTPISMTLGRHSNDEMISVYFETPSGFEFEYGWGAKVIGQNWKVVRHNSISLWGHEMVGGPTHHG